MKSILACWLLLLGLCLTHSAAQRQRHVHYPKNAGDIIAFVDTFSQLDFSVHDAIKRLGTISSNDPDHFRIVLAPFPSKKEKIRALTLETFEDSTGRRKLDSVEIEYIKPITISYGKLRKKFGTPRYTTPPAVNCKPHAMNCPPGFVGYNFNFVPDAENLSAGKRVKVVIDLKMEWSKVVPQNTDKDLLAVKAIRFNRIWRN